MVFAAQRFTLAGTTTGIPDKTASRTGIGSQSKTTLSQPHEPFKVFPCNLLESDLLGQARPSAGMVAGLVCRIESDAARNSLIFFVPARS